MDIGTTEALEEQKSEPDLPPHLGLLLVFQLECN